MYAAGFFDVIKRSKSDKNNYHKAAMSYKTFQQIATGRVLGAPYNAPTKEALLQDVLSRYTSCGDMLQMLDDLPVEAFVVRKKIRAKKEVTEFILPK
jgi:hypothetical protein